MTTNEPKELLLQAKGLQAWYGAAQILYDVDLDVRRGEARGTLVTCTVATSPARFFSSCGSEFRSYNSHRSVGLRFIFQLSRPMMLRQGPA